MLTEAQGLSNWFVSEESLAVYIVTLSLEYTEVKPTFSN